MLKVGGKGGGVEEEGGVEPGYSNLDNIQDLSHFKQHFNLYVHAGI